MSKGNGFLSDTQITIISGTISGTAATYIKQPIARVKWLRQVPSIGSYASNDNIIRLSINISKTEGIFGLWRGSVVSVLRNIPQSILVYTLYPKYYKKVTEFNSNINDQNRFLMNTIAGSLSQFSGTIITYPLDTLRVRTAVQYNEIIYNRVYSSILNIINDEGIGSFYKGLSMTLLGTVIRGGIGFGLYETYKHGNIVINSTYSGIYTYFWKLFVGLGAGTIATIITYPIDTIRRKQQVFGMNRSDISKYKELYRNIGGDITGNKNSLYIAKYLYNSGGIRIFFRGLPLGLIKSPIATSISLTVNDYIKDLFGWNQHNNYQYS